MYAGINTYIGHMLCFLSVKNILCCFGTFFKLRIQHNAMPKDTQPTSPCKSLNIFVTLEPKCLRISKLISKQCHYSILTTNKDLCITVLSFTESARSMFWGERAHTGLAPCLVQLILENNHLFLQLPETAFEIAKQKNQCSQQVLPF